MFSVVSVWLFTGGSHVTTMRDPNLAHLDPNTRGLLSINKAHTSIGKWVFGFRLKSFFGIGLPVIGKVLK